MSSESEGTETPPGPGDALRAAGITPPNPWEFIARRTAARITPPIAEELARQTGCSVQFWLHMQEAHGGDLKSAEPDNQSADDRGAYDVFTEPDPLRAMAYTLGDLLAVALLDPREADRLGAAKRGDANRLYVWERAAVKLSADQLSRDPATIIAWGVYNLVQAVKGQCNA